MCAAVLQGAIAVAARATHAMWNVIPTGIGSNEAVLCAGLWMTGKVLRLRWNNVPDAGNSEVDAVDRS